MSTDYTVYVTGHNLPGYLPESDPHGSDTFEDAKAVLIGDLKFYESTADTEDAAEDYCHAAEDVNLWSSPQSITVRGVAFWIDTVPASDWFDGDAS